MEPELPIGYWSSAVQAPKFNLLTPGSYQMLGSHEQGGAWSKLESKRSAQAAREHICSLEAPLLEEPGILLAWGLVDGMWGAALLLQGCSPGPMVGSVACGHISAMFSYTCVRVCPGRQLSHCKCVLRRPAMPHPCGPVSLTPFPLSCCSLQLQEQKLGQHRCSSL